MQLNYYKEYLRSSEHVWTAVGTLGLGLASAHWLGLLVGGAAYAISWIHLPSMGFFRRKVDAKAEKLTEAENQVHLQEFQRRRDQMRYGLSQDNQARYNELAAECLEIEKAGHSNEALFSKLDELMWTYLKLLVMEEAVGRFLEQGTDVGLDKQLLQAQKELQEIEAEKPAPGSSRERLLASRRQVVEVLQKRRDAVLAARDNLGIVHSEAERLGHQIRLLRAESVATHRSDMLTMKINSNMETLQDTNAMLSELSNYQELIGDMPPQGSRVGYGHVDENAVKRGRTRAQRTL